jgi:hypothetical protein
MNAIAQSTAAAAEAHTKLIVGPTIQMGDGSYFDFLAPEATTMTLEDYAWGLCKPRFGSQSRHPVTHARCLYFVVQHVCEGAEQMLEDGHPPETALAFMMHESDEVPTFDAPGPLKPLLGPVFKPFCKGLAQGIDGHFRVPPAPADLLKRYDIRMLATEKRDLMPHSAGHDWSGQDGLAALKEFGPFNRRIVPMSAPAAATWFMNLYQRLGGFVPGALS